MGVSGGTAAGGLLLGVEVCAPLVLLCGLCCWSDDCSDSSSKGSAYPKKPVVANEGGDGGRRRFSEVFTRRTGAASSASSLHQPSTSGNSKQQLASHRSHEEIPRRMRSQLDVNDDESRYHSAPSVIDEVLHRRDWERSTKDLYIPLKPQNTPSDVDSILSSPAAPYAEPESSSVECVHKLLPCKKHHTNIKSSRNKTQKEAKQSDVKDTDATEDESNFYIGDNKNDESVLASGLEREKVIEGKVKSVYKAKDAKQSFNESVRALRPSFVCEEDDVGLVRSLVSCRAEALDIDLDELTLRDGAVQRAESRASLITCVSRNGPIPPPVTPAPSLDVAYGDVVVSTVGAVGAVGRTRHASDGDILAAAFRPESGAFSESDLELDLEFLEEPPPAYHELTPNTRPPQETAI